ncbi:MAG: hypothetical protein F4X32_00985 [Candidatus Dadabacteria bacterium]|nr:hypothetical protein [Candidatus Dadabacteria bacterium]
MSKNRRISSFILFATTMSVALLLSGCQTLNWNEKWQSNFVDQMAVARDSQMLKNLVRMRYGNPPVFTTVEAVTEKYKQEPSKISLTGAVGILLDTAEENSKKTDNSLSGQVGIGATRETTFQYSPLTGKELNETMNQRLGLETVFYLTQSGFSIGRVLAITVERFGPALNAPFASGPTPEHLPKQEEFKKYEAILDTLKDLRQQNKIRFLQAASTDEICPEIKKEDLRGKLIACSLDDNFNCSCQDNNDLQWKELTNLLKVEDGKGILILTDSEARSSTEANEIKVRTRSLFGIMHYLSQNVKVPDGDREIVKISKIRNGEGYSKEGERQYGWGDTPAGKLFKIMSSDTQPQLICSSAQTDGNCASVVARHNGHWFYIDAKDHDSKATFALLTKLFEIQISGRKTNQGILLVQ